MTGTGIEPVTSSTQVRTYTTKRFEQLGNVFFLNLHDLKYHISGKYRNFKGGGGRKYFISFKTRNGCGNVTNSKFKWKKNFQGEFDDQAITVVFGVR